MEKKMFEGVKLPEGLSAKPFWAMFEIIIIWVLIVSIFFRGRSAGRIAGVGTIALIAGWAWFMFFKWGGGILPNLEVWQWGGVNNDH